MGGANPPGGNQSGGPGVRVIVFPGSYGPHTAAAFIGNNNKKQGAIHKVRACCCAKSEVERECSRTIGSICIHRVGTGC
jgi:hypothetical protein